MQLEKQALPFCVQPRFVPRLWGVRELGEIYRGRKQEAEPIGETWLTANDCAAGAEGESLQQVLSRDRDQLMGLPRYAGDDFPVLVKFLFPADRLSVQVHPGDDYAGRHGLGRGKTEMWHVLAAQPGARLGVNLRPEVKMAEFAAACRAGRGAECLEWQSARAGDTFYIPAGTIHAIGPGLVICEIQQQSDNTFRLDDYGRLGADGRPRQLHWEHGFAVARPHAGGGKLNRDAQAEGLLVNCRYFRVEKYRLENTSQPLAPGKMHVLAALTEGLRLEKASRSAIASDSPGRSKTVSMSAGKPEAAMESHVSPLGLTRGSCAVLPAGSAAGWELAGRGLCLCLDVTLPANLEG